MNEKKKKFIEEMEEILKTGINLSEDAITYFESLKITNETAKPKFTENGLKILKYMRDNRSNYNNLFSAKAISEGMGISSKAVSGANRKLVADGYLEKIGDSSPIVYSLTEKGINENIDAE